MSNKDRLVFRFYGINPSGELESPYVKQGQTHENERPGYEETTYYNFDPKTGEETAELKEQTLKNPFHAGISVVGLPTAKNSIFMGDELEWYNKDLYDKFYNAFKKSSKEIEPDMDEEIIRRIFNDKLYSPYSDEEPEDKELLIENMMEDLANQSQWSSESYFGDKPKLTSKDRTKLFIASVPESSLIDNKEFINNGWSNQRDTASELWLRSLNPKDSIKEDVESLIHKNPNLLREARQKSKGFYIKKPEILLNRALFHNATKNDINNEYFLPYVMYDILRKKGAKPSEAFFDIFRTSPIEFSDEQLKYIRDDMNKSYKEAMSRKNVINGLTKGDSKWR